MNFLFVLNILSFFLLSIYKPLYMTRFFNLKLANPFTIIFVFTFPILVLKTIISPFFYIQGGLFNKYYNFALFVTNLTLSIELVLMMGIFYFLSKNSYIVRTFSRIKNIQLNKSKLIFSGMIFFILFFICFILLASNSFGVLNWILHPREGYFYHKVGAGQWWILAMDFFAVAAVLHFSAMRRIQDLILVQLIYLVLSYLLGSKGFMMSIGLFILVFLSLRQIKNFNIYFLIFYFSSMGMALMSLIVSLGDTNYLKLLSYFDYYINATKYYEAYFNGAIHLYNGQVFLSQFWYIVPRSLFPHKPFAYGINLLVDYFYPGAAESGYTPSFMPAVHFVDFGIIGVVLFALINVYYWITTILTYLLFKNMQLNNIFENSKYIFIIIILYAPTLFQNLKFYIDILFVLFTIIALSLLWRTKIIIPSFLKTFIKKR